MKNNSDSTKTSSLKTLAILQNKQIGERLKGLRNLLAKRPEEISSVLSMSTNTLKGAENGENVGIEVINELILFYGYTLQEFYSLKKLPSWKALMQRIIKYHISIKSVAHGILEERSGLMELLEHRLIPNTKLFENWVDEQGVIDYCKKNYSFTYDTATNTLNSAVKKGWLQRDDNISPKKYKLS
ncbi:hypothetical protein [Sphingobacterium tabacisoli]|uniref:HTH cro/C1-type domain-containing protein n=1 Tax=Sphingobacterium tabacisoli TaxID=2044855 RepID=A0ABW5KZ70_9SPHI|nr:hypothetical protein [Sphingobacterium tabacisoli]